MPHVGVGAVGGLAVDGDLEHVAGGPALALHGGDLTAGEDGVDVHADGALHPRHDALTDHGLGALAQLLGGLEDEADGAAELLGVRVEIFHRSQQHGHVVVVAAGVHDALVDAGKIQTGLLHNGQGVHIGAQQHRVAALKLAALQVAVQARGIETVVGDSRLVQLPADAVGGLKFLEADLGMQMELAAEGHQLVHLCVDGFSVLVHNDVSFCFFVSIRSLYCKLRAATRFFVGTSIEIRLSGKAALW